MEKTLKLTDEQIKMFFGEKTKQSPTGRIFVRVFGYSKEWEDGKVREYTIEATELVNPNDKSNEAVRRNRIAERAKMMFMADTGVKTCKIISIAWDYEGTSTRWYHSSLYDLNPDIIAEINNEH